MHVCISAHVRTWPLRHCHVRPASMLRWGAYAMHCFVGVASSTTSLGASVCAQKNTRTCTFQWRSMLVYSRPRETKCVGSAKSGTHVTACILREVQILPVSQSACIDHVNAYSVSEARLMWHVSAQTFSDDVRRRNYCSSDTETSLQWHR